MKIKKNSLTIKVWLYLILFSTIILVFLYILQVGLLSSYYEWVKKSEIKNTASDVKSVMKKSNYSEELDKLSMESDMCIEIFDKNNMEIYKSSYINKGCFIGGKNGEELEKLKSTFVNSKKSTYSYEVENPRLKNKTLIYGVKSGSSYVFINSSLEPIENSVKIIQSQFVYIIIIIFITSLVIAFFISNKLSIPIIRLNESAKKLAKGDYKVKFDPKGDISELNELANTLNYAKEELSKTDELRKDLMANVSHDLKTPLTMIKAYAEMTRDIDKENKKKRAENLNIIIEESDRLNKLVNDILDLSVVSSNIFELNREKFDVCKLIREILKRYKYLEEKEKYIFLFKAKEDIMINADKKKIEQVIYNLINNAVKYTGSDKKVIIEIKKLKMDKIKISVIDTGKGIDKDEINYVWDKYYKSKKNYQRNLVGTGLGLSIVKNILEKHSYEYGINSKKNKGTEFYFVVDTSQ